MNENYKDICVIDKQLPIQQLNKLNEKGTKREDFFPISVVQAIFDKTGIRLDAIISSFNYIFLPWQGTKEATRLQVIGLMRRKSLVICYRNLDDEIIVETYIGNDRGDEEWQNDKNWKDFADWIVFVIEHIMGNLDDYPDIYEMIRNIIQEAISNLVDSWLQENADAIIKKYVNAYDFSGQVNNLFNNYIKSEEFISNINSTINDYLKTINFSDIINTYLDNYFTENPITDEYIKGIIEEYIKSDNFISFFKDYIDTTINNYLAENLEPLVGEFFTAIVKYLQNNERVIANALARHEQAITDLQNT